MIFPRIVAVIFLTCAFAGGAFGQAALRSVTSARELDQRTPAPDTARPAKKKATPAKAVDTRRTGNVNVTRPPTEPHDREARRAAAMFSKVLLAFNDREHGKRIMTQHTPSYRLEDWYYYPVRIKSLTGRKVEDKTIMVNPVTGKFKLEGAEAEPEAP